PEPELQTIDAAGALQDFANRVLRGQSARADELLKLAEGLKKQRNFSTARRILARARTLSGTERTLQIKLMQQHALCTYKDPNLPVGERLDRALEILCNNNLQDVATTKDQETLGLVGAIHKRKWEVNGVRQHLERSLFYYERGFNEGVRGDFGYTGIN